MQTERPMSLEFQEYLPSGNCPYNGEGALALPSSSSDHGATEKPAKRPTRRWAAWTREEEESFFTALRQVGKNFEKITSRVQSKNKDQVRHYYYRLVRRMNKLLGPGFSLDAKNSKDTNAAMLRWWSLLEKYSCKASKLHLKPRRFKIFIEALEHQLQKDRKKNVRRRSSQGENIPTLSPPPFPQQTKPSVNENRSVNFVLVDSQNIQKAGNGKAPTVRRAPSIGVNKCSNKGDSSPPKASRQRRKTAAVKKWEKAAIAGVSLVADAAEHLERAACGKGTETCTVLTRSPLKAAACSFEESCARPEITMPPPSIPSNIPSENNAQNTEKLKLQLFPIDDGTKRALEMDKHNPYLELTLSTRKKITSIVEHLNKKWGNSSAACGELMLFPYFAQREDVLKYQRWTRSSYLSAGDVYAMIGSPPLFRLRYGWISEAELQSASSANPRDTSGKCGVHEHSQKNFLVDRTKPSGPWSNTMGKSSSPGDGTQASSSHTDGVLEAMDDSPDEAAGYDGSGTESDNLDLSGFGAHMLSQKSLFCCGTSSKEMENTGVVNHSSITTREWADSLTNISVGDLLNEVSDEDIDCVEAPTTGTTSCVEQIPFSCDSFDAAIADHVRSCQNKFGFQSAVMPHSSSIWDAEETCDAFSFQKRFSNSEQAQSSPEKNYAGSFASVQNLPKEDEMKGAIAEGDPAEERQSDPNLLGNPSRDLNTLTDMYWPESLGPLDLDGPSSGYVSQDLILSDSLSGLSRLIANSLDAFQNCSFFSSPAPSAAEAQGKASTSGAANDVV